MDRDEISLRIGERLRNLRQSRGFSLDTLAQATGVSKPMLAQIERGASNPTVATLWKIASGLNVPFNAFISEPRAPARVLRAEEQMVLYEDDQRYQVFSTFTVAAGQTELYRLRLLPGGIREAAEHSPGVSEYITVSAGGLVVRVGGEEYSLAVGDAIHFQADVPHTYANPFGDLCEAHMAIVYPIA